MNGKGVKKWDIDDLGKTEKKYWKKKKKKKACYY